MYVASKNLHTHLKEKKKSVCLSRRREFNVNRSYHSRESHTHTHTKVANERAEAIIFGALVKQQPDFPYTRSLARLSVLLTQVRSV